MSLYTRDSAELIIGYEITDQLVILTYTIIANKYNVYSNRTDKVFHLTPHQYETAIGKQKLVRL